MTGVLPAPGPAPASQAPAEHRPARSPTVGHVGRPVSGTPGAAIAVGFVGGGAGTSALLWAVEEADRTGRALRLVSAAAEPVSPLGHTIWRSEVEGLARHLALTGLEYSLGSGPATEVLLAAVSDASLLVVGRQGHRSTDRREVGATAQVLGQHSPVPLIVVPQQWSQSSTFNAPVLVGSSALEDVDDDGHVRVSGAMWFALERATRYRVPLVIVSGGWEQPTSSAPTGSAPAGDGSGENHFVRRLDAFRGAHPEVEIASRWLPGSIEEALVETSGLAQLVVVSRPSTGPDAAPDGLVRHLLRWSSAPVAIIPPLP